MLMWYMIDTVGLVIMAAMTCKDVCCTCASPGNGSLKRALRISEPSSYLGSKDKR